jgi:hypothetical protein
MSCASDRAESAVAPTRSQNITVNRRRSASSGDTASLAVAAGASGAA